MTAIFWIVILIASLVLSFSILLQEKGAGLSLTFGGGGGVNYYSSQRGLQKLLHWVAIVSAIILFLAVFAFNFIVPKENALSPDYTSTAVPATGSGDSPTIEVQPTTAEATDEKGNPVKLEVTPVPTDSAKPTPSAPSADKK